MAIKKAKSKAPAKPAPKPAKKAPAPKKAAAAKKAPVKKGPVKKAPAKKPAPKKAAAEPTPKPHAADALALSGLPTEAVSKVEKWICLACVLDVFTRLMGLAPKTAHTEIRNYTPSAAELWSVEMTRPYFAKEDAGEKCPYCGSAAKWHARIADYRIESGKATDAARRDLVKSLPTAHDEFLVV